MLRDCVGWGGAGYCSISHVVVLFHHYTILKRYPGGLVNIALCNPSLSGHALSLLGGFLGLVCSCCMVLAFEVYIYIYRHIYLSKYVDFFYERILYMFTYRFLNIRQM